MSKDWVTSVTSADQEISQNMKIIRAFRALRILRLLRLLKLQRLVNIVYDFISSEYAFIMIGMLRLATWRRCMSMPQRLAATQTPRI